METLGNLAFWPCASRSPGRTSSTASSACCLGTLVGVLPGIGPVATVAMLLPITFRLSPEPALIMLAGIYYGAQYGGSTTAILVNYARAKPPRSSPRSTATRWRGRAGPAPALAIAAHGLVHRRLHRHAGGRLSSRRRWRTVALKFGPAEYFSLMVFGLIAAVVLAQRLGVQGRGDGRASACCWDSSAPMSTPASIRFTFGIPESGRRHRLRRAAPWAFFGIADVIDATSSTSDRTDARTATEARQRLAVARGHEASFGGRSCAARQLGSVLGLLPGGGAMLVVVRRLRAGEEDRQAPAALRRGRHRGRGRARIRQQCRRADLVHPDADARHPVQPDHGADDRRADDPGHHAGPAA